MSALTTPLPLVRPITDLRTHLNEVCQQAVETQEPIILTKNGVSAFVIEDCAAHDAAAQRNRAYLALREAEIEERYRPDDISEDEANARMREIFALWGVDYAAA